MDRMRVWLIILSLLTLIGLGLMMTVGETNSWKSFAEMLYLYSVIANIIVTYIYARKTGRQAGFWAFGALALPCLIPLILTALREKVSGGSKTYSESTSDNQAISAEDTTIDAVSKHIQGKKLFASIPEPISVFKYQEGLFKTSQWALDNQRLFCILLPDNFKWRVIDSTREVDFVFPDLMAPEDADKLYGIFDMFCESGNPNDFSGIEICLADYDNNGIVFELTKLRKDITAFLSGLYHFRNKRIKKLNQWLAGNPQVTLNGKMGSKATLNKKGFHLKKSSLSWPEVNDIKTITSYGLTMMFVLPEGRSGGAFDFKSRKYAFPRIPEKKTELYATECFFWRTYCDINKC